jgi:hypothetical protein
MTRPALALALAAAVGTTGCGLIFTSSSTPVTLETDPPGANITIDGQPIGKTPLTVEVSNRRDHIVTFQLGQGAPTACHLTASTGAGWVLLDIMGALIPVIIDAVSDGWTTLDQTRCHARIQTGEGAPSAAPVAASTP